MVISVLVRPDPENGFRATAPSHPEFSAEGPTEEAAVNLLRERMIEQLKQARLVRVEVPLESDKPWMAAAGVLANEPELEAYWDSIVKYRQEVNADPDR